MAIVVDLDPLGRSLQAKGLADASQQLRLGGAFRHLAAQGLAGVGQGVLDQLPLLAALGRGDLDLAAALQGEGLGQQRLFRGLDIDQDRARDRLVVVELAQEGGQAASTSRSSSDLSTRGK
jgi:hypothetical protein